MNKSCKYCGRIHDEKMVCDQKRKAQEKRWANRKDTEAQRFRRSYAWTEKSTQIRQRDHFICLCCKAELMGTITKFNTKNLSVHHIQPINEAYSERLADDNLITVCDVHHELCESQQITRERQKILAMQSIYENGDQVGDVCL